MALIESEKKAGIITLWDISRYFDSESIFDSQSELYKSEIRGKLYRLIYKLNEDINISVLTPVGQSEHQHTGSGVGQGTADGAVVSSVNLDGGVREKFTDVTLFNSDDDSVKYYKDCYHPVMFMDDLGKVSKNIKDAQDANNRMEDLMESKGLDLNDEKSVCMVIGENKARKKLLAELEKKPLTLYGKRMPIVEIEKYLGDSLCRNLSDSVYETVKKRIGIISHSIFEIRNIVDDARADSIGRLTVGFSIWESACVTALIHNSEVWVNIPKKAIKLLETIQLKYLRVVTGVGTSCPKPILYYHTGTLSMSNRVLLRKLLFWYHVSTLPTNSLAREVRDLMCLHDNPGLAREVVPVLEEFGITDIYAYSKYQFRKLIKSKIIEKEKRELLERARQYKKISPELLSKEEFGIHEYFKTLTVRQSRLRFRLHARLTPRVASCFKSDKRYIAIQHQCIAHREAGEPVSEETYDTEEHIADCIFYSDLKQDLALDTDLGITIFFQWVIARRTNNEKYVDTNDF